MPGCRGCGEPSTWSGWTEFHEVQKRTFDILFGTDHHLLIASGTSSSKTEAAIIPVVSLLHSNLTEGVGALYVGSTKAFIDDQFSRLDRMLGDSEVRVTEWQAILIGARMRGLWRNPPTYCRSRQSS